MELESRRDLQLLEALEQESTIAQRKQIAVYGTGDAAELVFLLIREMGLELVAVFEAEAAADRQFLGQPVLPLTRHADVTYDVIVVAVLERPAGTMKLLRQHGVPESKVLMLRPDWSAAQAPAAD